MARRRSRWRARLALLTGLAVVAAGGTAALVWPADRTDDQDPQLVVPAPVPPPAVLPAIGGDAPAPTPQGVRDAIDGLVRGGGLGAVGAAVVDAGTGTSLYAHAPDVPAVPASTVKLVTAVAVLATLGPAHQIPTVALAGAEPGEVVLVGGGDPTLAIDGNGTYPGAARLDELAEQVLDALDGDRVTTVVVDASRFTGDVYGPWDADIPGSGFVGPVTALMTDGGRVDPEQVRTPAARWDQPDLAAGEAFAELLDSGDGSGEDGSGEDGSGEDGISVVRGTAPVPGVAGTPTGGPVPGTELGRVLSPPATRLVEIMMADSDNVVAEALARQVALARGAPASYQGAAAALTGVLAALGVPVGDIVLADGSGLSRANRLTAAMLTDLLLAALADPVLAGMFAGLPVAGWSGTLAERFQTPQPDAGRGAGVVRAKTGTLSGVSALAGLVVTADGRLLVFALLANDAPFQAQFGLDRIAATLAGCGCS